MAGGVMLVMAPDAEVLEQLKRLADHRKEGMILEDDAQGLTLIFGPKIARPAVAPSASRPVGLTASISAISHGLQASTSAARGAWCRRLRNIVFRTF